MKRIIVALLLLIALSGCAISIPIGEGAKTPSFKGSYIAEAAYQGLTAVDAGDTVTIARNPQLYHESGGARTILGTHPDESAVKAYFAVSSVAHLVVSHWLDNMVDESDAPFWKAARIAWHLGGITLEAHYVAGNRAIGLVPFGGVEPTDAATGPRGAIAPHLPTPRVQRH